MQESLLLHSSIYCCLTDDESDEMALMKLTDEDRQVLMESLKKVEIDYPPVGVTGHNWRRYAWYTHNLRLFYSSTYTTYSTVCVYM